jgi:hypothetical protein
MFLVCLHFPTVPTSVPGHASGSAVGFGRAGAAAEEERDRKRAMARHDPTDFKSGREREGRKTTVGGKYIFRTTLGMDAEEDAGFLVR